jgi:hypothetical protein
VQGVSNLYSVALIVRHWPLTHPFLYSPTLLGSDINNQPSIAVRRHIDATDGCGLLRSRPYICVSGTARAVQTYVNSKKMPPPVSGSPEPKSTGGVSFSLGETNPGLAPGFFLPGSEPPNQNPGPTPCAFWHFWLPVIAVIHGYRLHNGYQLIVECTLSITRISMQAVVC